MGVCQISLGMKLGQGLANVSSDKATSRTHFTKEKVLLLMLISSHNLTTRLILHFLNLYLLLDCISKTKKIIFKMPSSFKAVESITRIREGADLLACSRPYSVRGPNLHLRSQSGPQKLDCILLAI